MHSIPNPKKSGGLLERFRAKPWHLAQFRPRAEGAMLVAVSDDIAGDLRAQTRDVSQQLAAGGIKFDTDGVDAAHDGIVQAVFERGLIHVVLVLAYPDRLGIQLDQLR